jgi:hypothetical protein
MMLNNADLWPPQRSYGAWGELAGGSSAVCARESGCQQLRAELPTPPQAARAGPRTRRARRRPARSRAGRW